jgi:hypothetical protein
VLKKSLKEILELDAEELLLWERYLKHHDPEQRADRRAAMICWAIGTAHGAKLSMEDFTTIIDHAHRDAESTTDVAGATSRVQIRDPLMMRDALRGWCIAAGGAVRSA